MRRITHALQGLAAFVLILAMSIAPAADAVSHGPGNLAAQADHSAWGSEQAAQKLPDRPEDHRADTQDRGHHAGFDHDHSTSAILQTSIVTEPAAPQGLSIFQNQQRSGIARDGLRRPPRSGLSIV